MAILETQLKSRNHGHTEVAEKKILLMLFLIQLRFSVVMIYLKGFDGASRYHH